MSRPPAGSPPPAELPLPLLGLALTRRPPAAALPLLVALHEWCLPATLDPAAGTFSAVLATMEGLHLAPPGVTVALWAQSADLGTEPFRSATVIVSDEPAVVAAAGDKGLAAPTGRYLGHRRPMSPFVRDRLRLERGQPADAILEWHPDGWAYGPPGRLLPIADELAETALGTAAAVVVTDPEWLIRALAWGAPVVTSTAVAGTLALQVPRQVLVADTVDERSAAAAALAADSLEAARLSWQGYRHAESLDAERAALTLVDRLRLWPSTPPLPAPPLPTVEIALRLLGTPPDAHVRSRLADASVGLSVPR